MILAIDPGPEKSAYLIWNGKGVQLQPAILPNADVLKHVIDCTSHPLISAIYIEKIACYGMAVGAEVFETVYWTGRFSQAWQERRGDEASRITRREIKLHICNSVTAKDPNVRQALIDRLGIVGTKNNRGPLYGVSSHLWAALGVAVTAWDKYECGRATSPAIAGARNAGNGRRHEPEFKAPRSRHRGMDDSRRQPGMFRELRLTQDKHPGAGGRYPDVETRRVRSCYLPVGSSTGIHQ